MWFEDGELLWDCTHFDLQRAIVRIGGIPAGTVLRPFRRTNEEPSVVFENDWDRVASYYAIGVKAVELAAACGRRGPFDDPAMQVEWRPQFNETLRCLDYRNRVVRRSGFPLITRGARKMGITSVMFFVSSDREAAELRAMLSDLTSRSRNEFGARVDLRLVNEADIRVWGELYEDAPMKMYFLDDHVAKRLASELKRHVEGWGDEIDYDTALDIRTPCSRR
ncbi:hypothetical protein ACDY97_36270 [Rhizobium mongolense]|uniref:hypothetical protein n=1 Tax=Rhizobium mongolense TaxID=57676 RepID=UPI0035572EC5